MNRWSQFKDPDSKTVTVLLILDLTILGGLFRKGLDRPIVGMNIAKRSL